MEHLNLPPRLSGGANRCSYKKTDGTTQNRKYACNFGNIKADRCPGYIAGPRAFYSDIPYKWHSIPGAPKGKNFKAQHGNQPLQYAQNGGPTRAEKAAQNFANVRRVRGSNTQCLPRTKNGKLTALGLANQNEPNAFCKEYREVRGCKRSPNRRDSSSASDKSSSKDVAAPLRGKRRAPVARELLAADPGLPEKIDNVQQFFDGFDNILYSPTSLFGEEDNEPVNFDEMASHAEELSQKLDDAELPKTKTAELQKEVDGVLDSLSELSYGDVELGNVPLDLIGSQFDALSEDLNRSVGITTPVTQIRLKGKKTAFITDFPELSVGKISNKNEEYGVRATEDLEPGKTFPYKGKLLTKRPDDDTYLIGTESGKFIDGNPKLATSEKDAVGQVVFANEPNPKETANAEFTSKGDQVFVKVTKPIPRGKEVLVCYNYRAGSDERPYKTSCASPKMLKRNRDHKEFLQKGKTEFQKLLKKYEGKLKESQKSEDWKEKEWNKFWELIDFVQNIDEQTDDDILDRARPLSDHWYDANGFQNLHDDDFASTQTGQYVSEIIWVAIEQIIGNIIPLIRDDVEFRE